MYGGGIINPRKVYCTLCGAWQGCLGLEPTPELYIHHLVAICQELRRVLRADGVFWLNLGSSYAASGGAHADSDENGVPHWGKLGEPEHYQSPPGYKSGDLIDIPHLVAHALQRGGWVLRDEVIWAKPSPMPESVNGWRWEKHRIKIKSQDYSEYHQPGKISSGEVSGGHRNRDSVGSGWLGGAEWADCPGCPKCAPNEGLVLRKGSWRCTGATESIFMFTKGIPYYGDREAVREPLSEATIADSRNGTGRYTQGGKKGSSYNLEGAPANPSWYRSKTFVNPRDGRNKRNVWTMNPEPLNAVDGRKHFATFPTELPTICIKASTSEKGVCRVCGAPWARVVETTPSEFNVRVRDAKAGRASAEEGYKASEEEIRHYRKRAPRKREPAHVPGNSPTKTDSTGWLPSETKTLGWRQTCSCKDAGDPVGAIVLDPFLGSGTTIMAALRLGCRGVGVALRPKYTELAQKRIVGDAPMLNQQVEF